MYDKGEVKAKGDEELTKNEKTLYQSNTEQNIIVT